MGDHDATRTHHHCLDPWPHQRAAGARANTPALAWNAINQQQRGLVLRHAPAAIRARLPDDVAPPTPIRSGAH